MRISDWSSDVCSSDLAKVETRGSCIHQVRTPLSLADEELVIVQLPTQLHRHIWGKSIISLPILPPSAERAPRWTLFATAVQAVSAEYWRRLLRCKKAVAQ